MFTLLLIFALVVAPQEIDPELKSVIERFFEMQAAEDANGYLALWSRNAKRPEAQQLQYIFESGDDRFLDLEIRRAVVDGDHARVRVAVTRIRTALNSLTPEGKPRAFTTRLELALAYVREDGAWKLVREGAPTDELAAALLQANDPAARAAMLEAEPDLVNSRLLEAFSRRADQQAQMSQYRQAQAIYERALDVARTMKDRKAEGQMLQNVANSLYFQRDFPAALVHYEKRLAIDREIANQEGIASALVGIATIRYSTHEYGEALKLYREALAIQEELDEPSLASTTLLSTGNVLYLQGDYDAAIADYRRAEALKRKFHDLAGAATALEGLGRTHAAQGDYAAALVAFNGVLDESRRRKDTRRQASALHNIADVHTRLVNLDAARAAYDESRSIYESAKDEANAGRTLQGIGVVELMAGRLPQAEAAYEKSHALCLAARPEADAECVARALVGLGFAQASRERWVAAIASYRKGIEAFGALRAPEAAARAQVGLAEALSGKKDYAAALVEATNARQTAVALGSDDLLWRALVSQSRAQRRLDRLDEAVGAAKAAVLAVRRMAADALLRPAYAVSRDTTAAYANAAVLQVEARQFTAAWDTVEEMRAHALRSALAPHERDIAAGMSEEERGAERAAAAELTALYTRRDREKGLPKPDAERLKTLDAAISAAVEKRAASQQQLFDRLPDLKVWRGLAPPATTADIDQRVLSDDELLVQFVVDDHDLLILTAQRSGESLAAEAHLVAVKRQALAETVATAMEPGSLADVPTWRKRIGELTKLLPQRVLEQLSAARSIGIVADDMLWRVPFEALPLGSGYLADQAQLRYVPSLTAVVRAPATPDDPWSVHVTVLAAPELPPAVVETVKTTAPTWTLRPEEIAQTEASTIAGVAGEERVIVLSGAEATEPALRSAGSTSTVLHVAGPFRVNAASPLFSSILLARGEASAAEVAPADNGALEAREVPTAGFKNRVVVFADPASLSMRDAAAAVPALQWVWKASGADAVIVRRWTSDEKAAGSLLASFYEGLREGLPATDAWHAARAAARTSSGTAAPIDWAGWMVVSAR